MSYTYSNRIRYEDTPDLDAFGRLRVSDTTTLLDIKFPYTKLPTIVDEVVIGGATSVLADSCVTMATTANNDCVIRQTIKAAPYQAGKSQLFEASFTNFAVESNVIKRVGYYTSTTVSPYNSGFDGYFLESDGVTNLITFQIWKNGVNIYTVPTASWLTTDYDPSLIDWTKTQLMMVDFQWLGVGRVRFSMVIDGTPRVFATHTGGNLLTTVYMDKPNKPIRYEIRQSGAGAGSFGQICSGVSMEGSLQALHRPVGVADFTERTLATGGTKYAVLGFRLNAATPYPGTSAYISRIDVLQTTNDNYLITVEKAPTLTGAPTWNAVTNTPLQYAYGTGAVTVTSPGFIMANTLGKSASISSENLTLDDSAFSLGYKINGTPEEWWICITPKSNNAKFFVSADIKYYG
jgi:hypothetical protein